MVQAQGRESWEDPTLERAWDQSQKTLGNPGLL